MAFIILPSSKNIPEGKNNLSTKTFTYQLSATLLIFYIKKYIYIKKNCLKSHMLEYLVGISVSEKGLTYLYSHSHCLIASVRA